MTHARMIGAVAVLVAVAAGPADAAGPSAASTPEPKAGAKAEAQAKVEAPVKPVAPVKAEPRAKAEARSDSSMTLRGGQAGTDFRTMTVEGEDRVHIDFGRPPLNLNLDPEKVAGLQRGGAADVLDRTVPDLASPLIALSTRDRAPYLGRPWLRTFSSGSVARFNPDVKGVERWKLAIADSRGGTVATYEGAGDPPKEIVWDGRSQSGAIVTPGITYSYVFEARDRAGNKRNFIGQGFTVSAYRLDGPTGPMLVLSGRDLNPESRGTGYGPATTASPAGTPLVLLEAASWLNQSSKTRESVRVTVAARTRDQANGLAARAQEALSGAVVGDPTRIQVVTEIAADAPEDGVLRIGLGK